MQLTKEQEKRVMTLIRRTWNVIAADLPHDVMTRDEIVEAVLDADYSAAYGRDKEADKWLKDELSYEEQDAIAYRTMFGQYV